MILFLRFVIFYFLQEFLFQLVLLGLQPQPAQCIQLQICMLQNVDGGVSRWQHESTNFETYSFPLLFLTLFKIIDPNFPILNFWDWEKNCARKNTFKCHQTFRAVHHLTFFHLPLYLQSNCNQKFCVGVTTAMELVRYLYSMNTLQGFNSIAQHATRASKWPV